MKRVKIESLVLDDRLSALLGRYVLDEVLLDINL